MRALCYERKHAIKLLGDGLPKATGQVRSGPEPVYGPVREVVERIWKASEQLCGKRLEPALQLWLPHYGKHFGGLLPTQKKLLKKVSAATLDRMLAPIKAEVPRRLCGTRPGTLLRTHIPIAGEVWDEKRAGFLEADSVAHCGASLAGDFIWSLTYTCLGSGWTEGRAVWNKGAAGVAYQRLMSSGQLESKAARRLRDFHQTLDPFELARQTEKQLKTILQ